MLPVLNSRFENSAQQPHVASAGLEIFKTVYTAHMPPASRAHFQDPGNTAVRQHMTALAPKTISGIVREPSLLVRINTWPDLLLFFIDK
jgi:hypothetical protein